MFWLNKGLALSIVWYADWLCSWTFIDKPNAELVSQTSPVKFLEALDPELDRVNKFFIS
jgi:hypothetical protein